MTLATPGLGERIAAPEDPGEFDKWDPANISPLVAWLCTEACQATAQVYWVGGNQVARYLEWARADIASTDGRWEIDDLEAAVGAWETGHVQSRSLRVTGTEDVPRG
jgi:hypothetical protein